MAGVVFNSSGLTRRCATDRENGRVPFAAALPSIYSVKCISPENVLGLWSFYAKAPSFRLAVDDCLGLAAQDFELQAVDPLGRRAEARVASFCEIFVD